MLPLKAFAAFLTFTLLNIANCDVQLSVYQNEATQEIQLIKGTTGPREDSNRIGWATFVDNTTETGWSILEVHTSHHFPDHVQAYYAGLMEGVATFNQIANHWTNTIGDYCKGQAPFCARLQTFLQENLDWMNQQIDKQRLSDPFWHQVGLILEQAAGLQDGYNGLTSNGPHRNLSVFGLYLITISGDMEDLEVILNKPAAFRQKILGSGKCSALIKVLPGNEDIYASQVTWNDLVSMIRILKHYNLGIHQLPLNGSPFVAGRSSSFSSYPGTIQSGDDFYTISSGLVTLETTIGNSNASLYDGITPDGILLEWVRAIAANRLATNGSEWADIFGRLNSGTYNNQWMVVDYNKFIPGDAQLQDGLLTVVEQIPTLVATQDVTFVLRNQTYWPSYNIPYNVQVFDLSGGQAGVDTYGDWFTYQKSPRAQIFRRDNSKVVDMDSMIKMMRYNDYTHDPLSRCNCTPPYSAENGIAARSDLNPADGVYPFSALGHRSHSATDAKITSYGMQKRREFIAIGGPPHEDVPAFQWSTSTFSNLSHVGHPDLWVFPPTQQQWSIDYD